MSSGLQTNLFIGMLIDEKMSNELDNCEPYAEQFFKQNNPDFLQLTTFENNSVIGKRLNKFEDADDLENVTSNIKSILRKILPEFDFGERKFIIFSEVLIG